MKADVRVDEAPGFGDGAHGPGPANAADEGVQHGDKRVHEFSALEQKSLFEACSSFDEFQEKIKEPCEAKRQKRS